MKTDSSLPLSVKRLYPNGDTDDSVDDSSDNIARLLKDGKVKEILKSDNFDNCTDSELEGESEANEIATEPLEPEPALRKRKRRRKRVVSICTANCRYEVVRRVAYRLGLREVPEDESWNLYWTDLSISVERCKEMKRFQKINHFPGMSEICRKDLLARNLNRMLKTYSDEYSFFPKSWCLPADMADVVAYSRTHRNKTYILKPDMGCQGRGIFITKSIRELRPHERMICQVYITRPFLIDGYKFDFRVYTLITSCDPLRIFVYNDGLVRFATSRYKEPTGTNTGNIYMHLTNYAVNKHSRMYIVDDELGSKRKISTLNRWFEQHSYDLSAIWGSIDDVIIKTVIAAQPMLKHSYNTCFPTHDYTYACFEILGFDILLDEHLKPFVLEVNHSPSFHTDSQIDRDIKEGLLQDTFQILNLRQCDKKKIIEEDRRRVRERLLKGIYKELAGGNGPLPAATPAPSELSDATANSPLAIQTKWEEDHKGNFRKVYPCDGFEKYNKFFQQGAISLFQETAASRAREVASRVQREETAKKATQEAAKRPSTRATLEKLRPESPNARAKAVAPKVQRVNPSPKVSKTSFEPVNIVEAEEMERLYQLKQREFLLKSYGLIEQIYVCLKKNRALRPEDEIKYGPMGKLQDINHNRHLTKLLGSISSPPQRHLAPKPIQEINEKTYQNSSIISNNSEPKGLMVKSNEAHFSVRPNMHSKWAFLSTPLWPATNLPPMPTLPISDVRLTKAQVARAFTNTAKLKQLERREKTVKTSAT